MIFFLLDHEITVGHLIEETYIGRYATAEAAHERMLQLLRDWPYNHFYLGSFSGNDADYNRWRIEAILHNSVEPPTITENFVTIIREVIP